jgi:hypothetical protein
MRNLHANWATIVLATTITAGCANERGAARLDARRGGSARDAAPTAGEGLGVAGETASAAAEDAWVTGQISTYAMKSDGAAVSKDRLMGGNIVPVERGLDEKYSKLSTKYLEDGTSVRDGMTITLVPKPSSASACTKTSPCKVQTPTPAEILSLPADQAPIVLKGGSGASMQLSALDSLTLRYSAELRQWIETARSEVDKPVAIEGGLTSPLTVPATSGVVLPYVKTNDDANDLTNGVFKAPKAGAYAINANALTDFQVWNGIAYLQLTLTIRDGGGSRIVTTVRATVPPTDTRAGVQPVSQGYAALNTIVHLDAGAQAFITASGYRTVNGATQPIALIGQPQYSSLQITRVD